MKQGNFLSKLLCLLLIGAALTYYQTVAGERAAAVSDNEAQIAQIEEYNAQVARENAALERRRSEAEDEAEEESGPYADGVYTGEGVGYGGTVVVSITVEGGYIVSAEATEHRGEDPAYYMLAESLLDAIVAAQSADVDAATGATFSSAGLMQAAADALEQAVK